MNTRAPSCVSNVERTSSEHVMSGPIVAQSAEAAPFNVADNRSPSSIAAATSRIVRMPLGVFGRTIGSLSVMLAVHSGTSSMLTLAPLPRSAEDLDQQHPRVRQRADIRRKQRRHPPVQPAARGRSQADAGDNEQRRRTQAEDATHQERHRW